MSRHGSPPSSTARPPSATQQPEQDPQRGGLAGAVRTEEAVHLAGGDAEVEPVERGGRAAERLAEASDLDGGSCHGRPPPVRRLTLRLAPCRGTVSSITPGRALRPVRRSARPRWTKSRWVPKDGCGGDSTTAPPRRRAVGGECTAAGRSSARSALGAGHGERSASRSASAPVTTAVDPGGDDRRAASWSSSCPRSSPPRIKRDRAGRGVGVERGHAPPRGRSRWSRRRSARRGPRRRASGGAAAARSRGARRAASPGSAARPVAASAASARPTASAASSTRCSPTSPAACTAAVRRARCAGTWATASTRGATTRVLGRGPGRQATVSEVEQPQLVGVVALEGAVPRHVVAQQRREPGDRDRRVAGRRAGSSTAR